MTVGRVCEVNLATLTVARSGSERLRPKGHSECGGCTPANRAVVAPLCAQLDATRGRVTQGKLD